jgi:hypothetical protein
MASLDAGGCNGLRARRKMTSLKLPVRSDSTETAATTPEPEDGALSGYASSDECSQSTRPHKLTGVPEEFKRRFVAIKDRVLGYLHTDTLPFIPQAAALDMMDTFQQVLMTAEMCGRDASHLRNCNGIGCTGHCHEDSIMLTEIASRLYCYFQQMESQLVTFTDHEFAMKSAVDDVLFHLLLQDSPSAHSQ